MDRIGFILMVMLATTGYSMGVNQESDYDDSEIRFYNETEAKDFNYHLYQKDIDDFFMRNEEFIKAHMLSDRDGAPGDEGEDENCMSTTKDYEPYVIEWQGEPHIVAQTKKLKLTQTIKETKCLIDEDGSKPSCFRRVLEDDASQTCVEKKSVIRVFIYNPKTNITTPKSFDVSVACECQYQQSYLRR